MRKLILMAALPAAWLFTNRSMANTICSADSTKIAHVLDGNISEWNPGKFETDTASRISYAVDNDGENLYVAMKITDQRVQFKIMSQGMSMYIDRKGKKREGSGIQFPMRQSVSGFGGRGPGGGGQGGGNSPQEIRERLSGRMLFWKAFGMENLEEDKTYIVSQPGLVNMSFTWDDDNVMYIEYRVPFTFIDDVASLKGKTISVGWRLHGGELPKLGQEMKDVVQAGTTVTSLVGVPAGSSTSGATPNTSRAGRGGRPGGTRGTMDMGPQTSDANEHTMWTKLALTF